MKPAAFATSMPKAGNQSTCTWTDQLGQQNRGRCSTHIHPHLQSHSTPCAGIFCAVVSHPADNMVSKLNNTKGATVGSVISEMGWVNLFTRGLPLRILMVGTLTGLQWGIYDAYKVRA